jgi:hypothetical protein
MVGRLVALSASVASVLLATVGSAVRIGDGDKLSRLVHTAGGGLEDDYGFAVDPRNNQLVQLEAGPTVEALASVALERAEEEDDEAEKEEAATEVKATDVQMKDIRTPLGDLSQEDAALALHRAGQEADAADKEAAEATGAAARAFVAAQIEGQ